MEGEELIMQFMMRMAPQSHREAASQWLLAWPPAGQSDPGQQRGRGRRHQKQLLPEKKKKSVWVWSDDGGGGG